MVITLKNSYEVLVVSVMNAVLYIGCDIKSIPGLIQNSMNQATKISQKVHVQT